MFHRIALTEQDAREAMASGEFSEKIRTSAERTAIVLTQDWCPQWSSMQRWLGEVGDAGGGSADGTDGGAIDVYSLEYNRTSYGSEFMRWKERELGNDLIPYVRYYRNGRLVATSNFVSKERFLSYFGAD